MKSLIMTLAGLGIIYSATASTNPKINKGATAVVVSYKEIEGKVIVTLKNLSDTDKVCFSKISSGQYIARELSALKNFSLEAFQSRTMVVESSNGAIAFSDVKIKCFSK